MEMVRLMFADYQPAATPATAAGLRCLGLFETARPYDHAAMRKVRVTNKSRARFRASFAAHHSARRGHSDAVEQQDR